MKFALQDILPNPFRRIGEYPIHPEKVRVLRESLRTTGFWDNLVARRNGDGTVEIAYGHHRLEALRQEYGPDHEIPLTIRPLDDDMMLKIMARENQEEWGTSAWVLMETVRALVLAYADGKIALGKPETAPHGLRFAPSFRGVANLYASRDYPYTVVTLAAFLGWWQNEDQRIPSYTPPCRRGRAGVDRGRCRP